MPLLPAKLSVGAANQSFKPTSTPPLRSGAAAA